MPSKKKKYNARFPAGRIKKIMQTDEEVGKVAQAVPIIISRTLELFVESLLTKAMEITSAKNAKTLSPSHMKQCILSESRFDFLKDLVKSLPDVTSCDSEDGTSHTNTAPQTCMNLVVKSEGSSVGSRRQQDIIGSREQIVGSRDQKEPVLQPPQTITAMSTRMAPNFYRERNEANVSSSAGFGHYSPTPSLSVSQTSAHPSAIELEMVDDDSDGENDDEDDKEESGNFIGRDPVSAPQYTIPPPQVNSSVDEDYDT